MFKEAKGGRHIFNDPMVGIYIYWWLNKYNGREYPKVALAEVVKTKTGQIIPRIVRYKSVGGHIVKHTLHFYINIPDIPAVIETLKEMYEQLRPKWEETMGSVNDAIEANKPLQPLSGAVPTEIDEMAKKLFGGGKA